MKSLQIILVLGGLVLAVLLFRLPKTLVTDTRQLSEVEEQKVSENDDHQHDESHSNDAFTQAHNPSTFSIDENKLSSYKKQFESVSDKKKRLIFADSIADLYKKAGNYDSVARYMELKAGLQPDENNLLGAAEAYFEAFSASGGAKTRLNDKSRSFYQKVIDLSPGNLDAKARMAMTYVATENPMQGIALLREVLAEDPRNETALYSLGILSIQSGQTEKAVERFKELLTINPTHANGRFYLGLAYMNLGKKKSAREEFEKARQLDGDPRFQSVVDSFLKEIN